MTSITFADVDDSQAKKEKARRIAAAAGVRQPSSVIGTDGADPASEESAPQPLDLVQLKARLIHLPLILVPPLHAGMHPSTTNGINEVILDGLLD